MEQSNLDIKIAHQGDSAELLIITSFTCVFSSRAHIISTMDWHCIAQSGTNVHSTRCIPWYKRVQMQREISTVFVRYSNSTEHSCLSAQGSSQWPSQQIIKSWRLNIVERHRRTFTSYVESGAVHYMQLSSQSYLPSVQVNGTQSEQPLKKHWRPA